MKYWLIKSEPDVWSIDQQIKSGQKGSMWDGVRNYQAANNLRKMKKGDQCFFYHSNIGKEIVGIVKVIREAYQDPTDKSKRFVAVQVRFEKKLDNPIFFEKYFNKIITPSSKEININPKSKSAKLRYAIRSNTPFFEPVEFRQKFSKYIEMENIND